ncbi:hypothetical protein BH20PSE1_BH20PSE1_09270 [soil metagenome]
MSRATPKMRDFAERLIAYEARENKSSETKTLAAFHVPEKLRPQLATLMGNTGFRALLSRALALANAEVPWLRAVHVKSDGSLEGLDKLEAQVDSEEISEGRVVLLAQLLGLLVAFIGENLTLWLVHEVWPKLSLNALDLGVGAQPSPHIYTTPKTAEKVRCSSSISAKRCIRGRNRSSGILGIRS